MMWVYNNRSDCFELKLQSYLFELLYQLYVYFKAEQTQQPMGDGDKYIPRLSGIIHYLQENYKADITLKELAEKEYLSLSYLSRFFKKYIGSSFKEYMIRLRLEHAVNELLYTDKSIAQLAYDNGFPSSNSFLNAFKDTYGEAPSLYRKKAKADYGYLYGPNRAPVGNSNNYFELANLDIFTDLYKYLMWNQESPPADQAADAALITNANIDLSQKGSRISHSWRKLLTIGKAKDLLNPVIKEQLRMVQQEIGFAYLRFHGIFDDEMMIYQENLAGNPVFHFDLLDQVLDFLSEIGLKPFVELSFMPTRLARDKHTVFSHRPSCISMPKDMDKWCLLVRNTILHCMDRYGAQVEEWYFEFWNEPDMTGLFWYDTKEDYFSFYDHTYRTIKSISPSLRIGGPAICNLPDVSEWLSPYFEYCKTHDCLPDFFTFHCYLLNSGVAEINRSFYQGVNHVVLSRDPDYLKNSLQRLKELVSPYHYHADKLHMTEWNASPSHRDLSRDTLFMASYIVKNIVENMDAVASFGYWTITDYIEEVPLPEECFHGGLGVITANGIKKAGYHAFVFLSRLGCEKISSGPGYYVTRSAGGYQILLYNYCHYDPLYCSMDHSGISTRDRYGIYQNKSNKLLQLTLTGLPGSSYRIREQTVSPSQGSVFDTWADMGYPEPLSKEHITYLQSKSIPHYREMIEFIEGSYHLERLLAPHEIKLIEINAL